MSRELNQDDNQDLDETKNLKEQVSVLKHDMREAFQLQGSRVESSANDKDER